MFKIKSFPIFLLMSLIVTGCGEAMRTNAMEADKTYQNSPGNNIGPTPSGSWTMNTNSNPVREDADQRIMNTYSSELQDKEDEIVALGQKIKAFDVSLSRVSKDQLRVLARITFNCIRVIDYEATLNQSDLTSLKVVNINAKDSYDLRLQCTSNNCTNMVVAVRHNKPVGATTLLVGMEASKQVGKELVYTSRRVSHSPYFQFFDSYDLYSQRNDCSIKRNSFSDQLQDAVQDRIQEEIREEVTESLEQLF